MAIDSNRESLLSLTEATKWMPRVNGKRPAISTLWRWCRKGMTGVRLEYVRIGRNIATSREALDRFFNALAAADKPIESPAACDGTNSLEPSGRGRQRMLDDADRILERARI